MYKKMLPSYVGNLSKIIEIVEDREFEALTMTQVGSPILFITLGYTSFQANVSEIFSWVKAWASMGEMLYSK